MRGYAVARIVQAIAASIASAAAAQPATQIRFPNGTNVIVAAPGERVPVSIYAVGLWDIGTTIRWSPPLNGGAWGSYAGFLSVFMDVKATSPPPVARSGMTIPGGMGFQTPPFGSAGVASGQNVLGVNIGVGFNPPVTGNEFLLWEGAITVGASNVSLATQIGPIGTPPQTGFEIAIAHIIPGFNLSQFIPTLNGTAFITVPAPAMVPLAALGCLVVARRRRR